MRTCENTEPKELPPGGQQFFRVFPKLKPGETRKVQNPIIVFVAVPKNEIYTGRLQWTPYQCNFIKQFIKSIGEPVIERGFNVVTTGR